MEYCKYRMNLADVPPLIKNGLVLCAAYHESRRPDGMEWGHFPVCRDDICPLLHPELLDGAVLEEFHIGDKVRVMHPRQCYDIFEAWVVKNCPENLQFWRKGACPSENEKVTIVCIAGHADNPSLPLYGVMRDVRPEYHEDPILFAKTFFVMSEYALKKEEPSK